MKKGNIFQELTRVDLKKVKGGGINFAQNRCPAIRCDQHWYPDQLCYQNSGGFVNCVCFGPTWLTPRFCGWR